MLRILVQVYHPVAMATKMMDLAQVYQLAKFVPVPMMRNLVLVLLVVCIAQVAKTTNLVQVYHLGDMVTKTMDLVQGDLMVDTGLVPKMMNPVQVYYLVDMVTKMKGLARVF